MFWRKKSKIVCIESACIRVFVEDYDKSIKVVYYLNETNWNTVKRLLNTGDSKITNVRDSLTFEKR